MSYAEYLENFGSDMILKFKENVLNSKEFTGAFLDVTSHLDEEQQSDVFNRMVDSMISTLKHR